MSNQEQRTKEVSMLIVKSTKGRDITIPQEIWDTLKLKNGELFEVSEKNGRIILLPKHDLDKDQLLYWSEECQTSVKEGLKDLEEGRSKTFDNVEDLIKDLRS